MSSWFTDLLSSTENLVEEYSKELKEFTQEVMTTATGSGATTSSSSSAAAAAAAGGGGEAARRAVGEFSGSGNRSSVRSSEWEGEEGGWDDDEDDDDHDNGGSEAHHDGLHQSEFEDVKDEELERVMEGVNEEEYRRVKEYGLVHGMGDDEWDRFREVVAGRVRKVMVLNEGLALRRVWEEMVERDRRCAERVFWSGWVHVVREMDNAEARRVLEWVERCMDGRGSVDAQDRDAMVEKAAAGGGVAESEAAVDSKDQLISMLQERIRQLEMENAGLRTKLSAFETDNQSQKYMPVKVNIAEVLQVSSSPATGSEGEEDGLVMVEQQEQQLHQPQQNADHLHASNSAQSRKLVDVLGANAGDDEDGWGIDD